MLNGTRVFLNKFSKNKNFWPSLFVGLTYLILGYRFFSFIIKNSVNIIFMDQWDAVNEVLISKNYLAIFLTQHNEHRIGTGLLLMKLLAYFSHWNNLAETVTIGLIIFLSSIIALLIKKKITKKIEIYDMVIPFIFLNLYQWDNLTWGFQITFTLPILFLFLALYLTTFANSIKRNIGLLVLVLLSTYSSFHGIFLGGIVGLFFLVNYFLNSKKQTKIQCLIFFFLTATIASSYFIGYHHAGHLDGFRTKTTHFQSYLQYINFQINSFIGNYSFDLYYYLIPLTGLCLFIVNLIKLFKSKFKINYFIIFSLFLFSIAFTLSTAYGRVVVSVFQSQESRYVTLLIPFYLAVYLTLSMLKSNCRNSLIIFTVFFYIYFSSLNTYLIYQHGLNKKKILNNWKECYLEQEDIKKCNLKYGFSVYPDNIGGNKQLKEKFDFLKRNKLNIYSR